MIKIGNVNEPVLVSFPRSGTNWVRYCIEFFSRQRTPGNKRLVEVGKPVISRIHDAKGIYFDKKDKKSGNYVIKPFLISPNQSNYKKMILLIRNPFDNYVSQNKNIGMFSYYFGNIEMFEEFDGEKLLIYFEDVVKEESEIYRILDFLDINYEDRKDKFHLNFGYHKLKSKGLYEKNHNKRKKGNRNELTDDEKNQVINFINKKHINLKEKYLKRYFE